MTKFKEDTVLDQAEPETSAQVVSETEQQDPAAVAQKALNVLVQAVEFAQSKGVYSFEDSHHIFNALKVFSK